MDWRPSNVNFVAKQDWADKKVFCLFSMQGGVKVDEYADHVRDMIALDITGTGTPLDQKAG
jgi:hypothetical protein